MNGSFTPRAVVEMLVLSVLEMAATDPLRTFETCDVPAC